LPSPSVVTVVTSKEELGNHYVNGMLEAPSNDYENEANGPQLYENTMK